MCPCARGETVLRIRDIFERIRIRGSVPLTITDMDLSLDPAPSASIFSVRSILMRKGKDPDPYLWLMGPDPDSQH
jgi:hypothetical protein